MYLLISAANIAPPSPFSLGPAPLDLRRDGLFVVRSMRKSAVAVPVAVAALPLTAAANDVDGRRVSVGGDVRDRVLHGPVRIRH